ncbi:MAG: cyclic nucleotide-binding domain-containing protein [Desulfovibrionales bacterium]|nr:cyclic nucleotide-binding domain-containing protein [Desulfovibrionales bacterium]
MLNLKESLKCSAVFGSIGEKDLDEIVPFFEARHLTPGEMLMTLGSPAKYFYLLGEGSLLLSTKEGKALILSSPGDFVAMDMVSEQGLYTGSLTALEDGVAFVISRDDFSQWIRKKDDLATGILDAWTLFLGRVAPFVEHKGALEHL